MIMSNLQEWIVPISSSVVAIVIAVLTCRWQMSTELRKIRESYAADRADASKCVRLQKF